jgi:hypothetical protein
MKSRLPAVTLTILAALSLAGFSAANAAVITYIDLFDQDQFLDVKRSTATNSVSKTDTVASSNSIGGYRTMFLGITAPVGSTNALTTFEVTSGTAALASPNSHIPTYELKWGGSDGSTGFAPVDFKGGLGTNFSLVKSTLNFTLLDADQNSPFTWTFRDTSNVTATYSGILSNTVSPGIGYAISLASFTQSPLSPLFDWSSINFISLSGGGIASLDVTFSGAMSVTAQPIPEPGTWAAAGLLLLTAGYIRWRRSRSAGTQEEAPAAA